MESLIEDVEWAERLAYEAEEARQSRARLDAAFALGYRAAAADPLITFICPTCAASVALSGTGPHAEWHKDVLTRAALVQVFADFADARSGYS